MNYLKNYELLETLVKWKAICLYNFQEESLYKGNSTTLLSCIFIILLLIFFNSSFWGEMNELTTVQSSQKGFE